MKCGVLCGGESKLLDRLVKGASSVFGVELESGETRALSKLFSVVNNADH